MRILALMTAVLLCIDACSKADAETIDYASRTRVHTVKSSVLNEKRTIYVRTPPGYDGSAPLPVIYVTDAEWNFDLVAAHFDFMIDNGAYPPVLVTGVRNVNRNRDFLPRADDDYNDSGGAEAFLDFVVNEWAPHIERHHTTTQDRVLIGHSFGGVFALHALFSGRDFFDGYVSLSPSSWVADRVLFDEAREWLDSKPTEETFAYVSVGEGDGGPTVPSSKELSALIEADAPETLEWIFSVTPAADHFKNFTAGLHEGLMALFPAWGFPQEARIAGEQGGASGVNDWFADKESSLGFRFYPSWFDFGVAAIRLSSAGNGDAGIAVIERTLPYHRRNANFAAFAAQTYENAGRYGDAIREYERAITIARRDKLHPNVIHFDRLEAGVDRIKAKMAEAGAAPEK